MHALQLLHFLITLLRIENLAASAYRAPNGQRARHQNLETSKVRKMIRKKNRNEIPALAKRCASVEKAIMGIRFKDTKRAVITQGSSTQAVCVPNKADKMMAPKIKNFNFHIF